jgi:hypothetical protein
MPYLKRPSGPALYYAVDDYTDWESRLQRCTQRECAP